MIVMEPKRLSTTQVVIRDGDAYISRYSVALVGGGSLVVCMPASLRQQDASEVVGQFAELTDVLEQEHGLLDRESSAREALLVGTEILRQAARESLDLEEARQLIASYDLYREAVAEYLRTTRCELPPGIA
jgi:hypothetical protein